jgi:hypothetical protein
MAIEDIDGKKKQLTELASVLNSFKSEAVQLRLLDHLLGGAQVGEDQPPQGSNSRPPSRRRKQPKKSDVKGEGSSQAKKKQSAPGNGPNATVTQLLTGDFFKKSRTIGNIVEHCKHNLARSFKANEISGKLAQLVRAGQLTRVKNAEKQYEYKKP